MLPSMEDNESLSADDIIMFIETLQDEADELTTLWIDSIPGMERYELMQEICLNAHRQAKLRAWLYLVTENKVLDFLYTDNEFE